MDNLIFSYFDIVGGLLLVVVDNLFFGVFLNECFGFLGINGVGKIIVICMLIGEEVIIFGIIEVSIIMLCKFLLYMINW